MKLTLKASDVYPPEVETLLRTLAAKGFFERGLLIGSDLLAPCQENLAYRCDLTDFDNKTTPHPH